MIIGLANTPHTPPELISNLLALISRRRGNELQIP